MKHAKRWILILMGGMMMLSLFGCGKPKYKLQFDGFGFQSEKTEYAEGETVTVRYDLIATDTDYRFWLDDDTVEMDRDYDDAHGYIFRFSMPAHDLTLHVSSHNSMAYIPRIEVTLVNELTEADFWVLPQTEENLKSSLWGTASAEKLGTGETAELSLQGDGSAEHWIVRVIDTDHLYFAAEGLTLEDGDRIVLRRDGADGNELIEVQDQSGAVRSSTEAFVGAFGAE